jgi:putative restriction endonuclease
MRGKSISWENVAAKTWPILAKTADQKTTLSYKELGDAIGLHHRSIRYVLEVIQQYCIDAQLPPLTGLVVRQHERVPGSGFVAWDIDDLEAGLGRVYATNWSAMPNPFLVFGSDETIGTLANQLVKNPASSGDVLRQVKDRGIAQQVFREGLLRAYDFRCAMCELSFPEVLQAAHIVPFYKCAVEQRISITNGVLLCANHHLLFENELVSVSPDFTITYRDPTMKDGPYTSADKAVSVRLHGKRLRCPADPRLWPKFDGTR